jgi:hypothetical protein
LYVLSRNGKVEGQLLISKNCSFISFGSSEFNIDRRLRIYEKKNSELLGYYRTANWIAIFGYKDKLVWGDKEYSFEKVKPDVSHSIFDKKTWGNFKFQLGGENDKAIYRFRIEIAPVVLGNPYLNESISGSVELNSVDSLIALAGFRLLERALDNETLV